MALQTTGGSGFTLANLEGFRGQGLEGLMRAALVGGRPGRGLWRGGDLENRRTRQESFRSPGCIVRRAFRVVCCSNTEVQVGNEKPNGHLLVACHEAAFAGRVGAIKGKTIMCLKIFAGNRGLAHFGIIPLVQEPGWPRALSLALGRECI